MVVGAIGADQDALRQLDLRGRRLGRPRPAPRACRSPGSRSSCSWRSPPLAPLLAAVQVLSLGSADFFRGQGKEFEAAITAVIGGTSLSGGAGSIVGTAIGALTLGVVRQGLFFAGVDYDWYQAVLGLMLLAAVLINQHVRKQGAERG